MTRGLSWWAIALLVLAAGLALGGLGRLIDYLPPPLPRTASLGAPWLVGAFAVGAIVGRPARGALAAGLALPLGVGVYYVLMLGVEGRADPLYASVMTIGWSLVAAGAGALLGWAGGAWRAGGRGGRRFGAAAVGAVLLGEALALSALWTSRPARALLAAELALGALLPLLLVRGRERIAAGALAVLLALVVAAGETGVRDVMRAAGWAGA